MPIYLGGTLITNLKLGGATPTAVHIGATKVYPGPAPTVSIAPTSGAGYAGGTVAFTATATGTNVTYQWRVGGAPVSGQTASTYTHTIAGNASVDCVVTDAYGQTATSNAAAITQWAAPTCTIAPTSGAGYAGAIVNFTATPGGGSGTYTYQWNVGGVPVSGQTAATYAHTLATNGEVVTCTVTSSGQSVTSAGATMTVYAPLGSAITPTAINGTEGEVVAMSCTPSGGDGAYTYQWYLWDNVQYIAIAGATAPTYNKTLVLAENGWAIICQVGSAGALANSPHTVMTVAQAGSPIVATGGVVTDSGGYRYHTFTASGSFQVTALASGPYSNNLEVCIVAGGGGGGGSTFNYYYGAGGGAGGMVEEALPAAIATYGVTVGGGGAGGTPGGNGANSGIDNFTTAIGGGGGSGNNFPGVTGGSGGGGFAAAAGAGTAGQGNAGAKGNPPGGTGSGGGGGAGAPGNAGVGGAGGGAGGAGKTWLNGVTYAGGGGGSQNGAGGVGGGGLGGWASADPNGAPGAANTGGGGGGGVYTGSVYGAGGTGGSGIVIIRYQI